MAAIDAYGTSHVDYAFNAWEAPNLQAETEDFLEKGALPKELEAPASNKGEYSLLGRVQKLDGDGLLKLLKFVRGAMLSVGEVSYFMGNTTLPAITGMAKLPSVLAAFRGKTIADSLGSAKKVFEVFVDTIGSKGAGRLWGPGKGGFIESVKTGAGEAPFANPKTAKERAKNAEHSFDVARQFYMSTGAMHNVLKAAGLTLAIAKGLALVEGSPLSFAAAAIKTSICDFFILDSFLLDLPMHFAAVGFHSVVAFSAAKEGFKEGFYASDDASMLSALKEGMKEALNNLTDRYVVENHILPAVRFSAHIGLIVGMGVAFNMAGSSIVAGLARSCVPSMAKLTGKALEKALGEAAKSVSISGAFATLCILTESSIGMYRAWIKTYPKEEKVAEMAKQGAPASKGDKGHVEAQPVAVALQPVRTALQDLQRVLNERSSRSAMQYIRA